MCAQTEAVLIAQREQMVAEKATALEQALNEKHEHGSAVQSASELEAQEILSATVALWSRHRRADAG